MDQPLRNRSKINLPFHQNPGAFWAILIKASAQWKTATLLKEDNFNAVLSSYFNLYNYKWVNTTAFVKNATRNIFDLSTKLKPRSDYGRRNFSMKHYENFVIPIPGYRRQSFVGEMTQPWGSLATQTTRSEKWRTWGRK